MQWCKLCHPLGSKLFYPMSFAIWQTESLNLRSRATMLNVLDQRVGLSFTTITPHWSNNLCVAMEDLQKSFTTDLALSRTHLTLASFCTMWTTSCKVCITHGVRSISMSTWCYLITRGRQTNKHKLYKRFLYDGNNFTWDSKYSGEKTKIHH